MQVKGPEGAWQGMTNKCVPDRSHKHQPKNWASMRSCLLASEKCSDRAGPSWRHARSLSQHVTLVRYGTVQTHSWCCMIPASPKSHGNTATAFICISMGYKYIRCLAPTV